MYKFEYQLKQTDFLKFQIAHVLTDKRTHIMYILIALVIALSTTSPLASIIKYALSFLVIYVMLFLSCIVVIIPFTLIKKDFLVLSKTHLTVEKTHFFSQSKFAQTTFFGMIKSV